MEKTAQDKVCKHIRSLGDKFKVLSLEEKKNLNTGSHVYIKGNCGCFLRVTINGTPKTWKRQLGKVKVPYKYGLYEYGYILESTEVRVPLKTLTIASPNEEYMDEKQFNKIQTDCPVRWNATCSIRLGNPVGNSFCLLENCPFIYWAKHLKRLVIEKEDKEGGGVT